MEPYHELDGENESPVVPPYIQIPTHTYDYGAVEDIAQVEYTYAMIASGLYVAFHVVIRDFLPESLWIIVTTSLAVTSWWYFQAYFKAVKDTGTARWINLIMGSLILFGITNLYLYLTSDVESIIETGATGGWDALDAIFNALFYSVLASLVAILLFSGKLIAANTHHTFPMKRIAVSTMICLPLYMYISMVLNIHSFWQIIELLQFFFGGDTGKPQIGLFANLFLAAPYLFLFQFFYRANKYDRTP